MISSHYTWCDHAAKCQDSTIQWLTECTDRPCVCIFCFYASFYVVPPIRLTECSPSSCLWASASLPVSELVYRPWGHSPISSRLLLPHVFRRFSTSSSSEGGFPPATLHPSATRTSIFSSRWKACGLNLLELSCLANMVIWCTESVKLQLQVTWWSDDLVTPLQQQLEFFSSRWKACGLNMLEFSCPSDLAI